MKIKLGPAGLGPTKAAIDTLRDYKEKGFGACELAFTHGVYIKSKEDARKIGEEAKKLGIKLSIHGQYYLNLNSEEKEKREATKKRILECCEIGEELGAELVVFHPGYYGTDKNLAHERIKEGILDIMKVLKNKGWKIKIAPETMGKVNVFGSLEEISTLVKETGCSYCIDFAHILARDKSVDYSRVVKLFPEKNWHVHFSGIIYNEKGEKSHKPTEKKEWEDLLRNLPKDKEITIINESPTMIEDTIEGLKILKKI